ncbi:MAG: toxin-antitoxin system TumE family protein [Blastocatellia bacterium]
MSKPPDTPLTRKEYEEFIYTISESYPAIEVSTLVVIMIASENAEVFGEILFADDIRLEVTEVLSFDDQRIEDYGYTVYRGEEKLYWYDSQPHPNDPSLASTDPHHKHVAPDIKHNRIPAPGLSFTQPNLPFLIEEILSSSLSGESADESDD